MDPDEAIVASPSQPEPQPPEPQLQFVVPGEIFIKKKKKLRCEPEKIKIRGVLKIQKKKIV